MPDAPKIFVAKCAICREGISALENDDTWLHNLGGFRGSDNHEPRPAEGTIRPLYAFPGLENAEPSA